MTLSVSPTGEGAASNGTAPGQSDEDNGLIAESPAAKEGVKEPESMLDAVKTALDGATDDESPTSESGDAKAPDPTEEEAEEGGEGEDDTFSPEELSRLNQKVQRRVRKLSGKVKHLTRQLDDAKVSVDAFNQIQADVAALGLSGDDVDAALQIASMVRRAPADALTRARNLVAYLEGVTGETLPADLQQAVDGARISEEHARELSRLRSGVQASIDASRQAAERARAHQTQTAQATGQQLEAAVNAWDQEQRRSPDYIKVRTLVRSHMQAKLEEARAEGKAPTTAAEARALADRCLAEVKGFLMAPSRAGAVTPLSERTAVNTATEPASMREAIRGALAAG